MTDQVAVELVARFEKFRTDLSVAGSFMKGVFEGMRDELRSFSADAQKHGGLASMAINNMADKVEAKFQPMNDTLGKFRAAWAAAAAVVGVGMLAKKGIDEAVQLTVETQKLARALNIGATEANNWRIAIGDVYGSTDEFITLTQAMNRQLRNNEDGLKAMGLATRDANGDFRDQKDLVLDALGVLREYKAGTDRNLAAQELFGRGVSVTSELLDLNAQRIDDAREKAEALGAVVGQENVEAVSAYRAAMNDAGDVVEALWKAVGDMLMPVMTELANFLAENGPDAVRAMKIAVGILATAFDGLAFAAQSAWAVIKAGIQSIGSVIGGFSVAISKAFSGDFAGAKAELSNMASAVKDNFGAAYDTIIAKAERTRDRLFARVSGNTTEAVSTGSGGDGKGYQGKGDGEDEKKKREALAAEKEKQRELERIRKEAFQARMTDLKSELDEWRNNYDERLRIARKMAEDAKATFGEESKEYKKAAAEVVKIEREKAEQIARIVEIEKEAKTAAAYAGVDAAEQAAELDYQLGVISLQQRLALQQQFENERYQIARQALEDRLLLMSKDPDMNPEEYARIKNDILNLEIQHRQMLREIGNQQIVESAGPANNVFQSMEQGFQSSLQGMLTRAQTWRQALTGLYRQVFASYLQEMVTKPLAQMAMRAVRETAIGRLIATQSVMMQRSAAGQSMAIKASESTANIAKSAATAGAGAAESQASIPYVGPVLALAAMAAIFAAVMALGGGGGGSSTSVSRTELPSAAGGFDIPAGLNPLTQLHEREMVLPAEHADAIRGMAGGGMPPISIAIHALDGASVRRVLMDNKSELARALRAAARDFSRG